MKIEQRITASFDFPVVFTHDVFDPENLALVEAISRLHEKLGHRAVAFVDGNLARVCPDLCKDIGEYFHAHRDSLSLLVPPEVLASGEAIKNGAEGLAACMKIVDRLLDLRLDRHSCVIAIGGGALLDVVGFAASLVHRGLRLIRVPTTVLAQGDSGVGVKNGINFHGSKNALGTFAAPFAVVNDFEFLPTLPDREWRGGIAEAFKVAIIRDRAFFDWLCANSAKLRARDFKAMQQLVKRCAELHLEHIRSGGDPFEMGRARPLDFGHWAAHKLELLSEFHISHGEAVAAGIALDSRYAAMRGWLSEPEVTLIHRGLEESGLALWFEEMQQPELFDGLREFQEHLGGELCVTFPDGIGAGREENEVDLNLMRRALETLVIPSRVEGSRWAS